ncbi:Rhs-family protein [hydrothermal vent metagenome]|uniref:Rhs-family protein n=1 Tax=hydrothermal vent metagenome TaxID=652676 RepID=A0A1W1BC10_9ZZZZ
MKSRFLHMTYIAFVTLILVGCGGGGGSSSDETTTTTTETPVATVPEQVERPVDTTTSATEEVVEDVVKEPEEETTSDNGSSGGSSSSGDGSTSTPASGVAPANKGPFKKGSNVTAYKLNRNGTRSTETLSVLTTDDKGTFSITIPWTGATEFNVVGEYLNEATGTYMGDGNLSAIVDMVPGSANSIGINVFTHMAAVVMKKKMLAADANGSTVSATTLKEEASAVIAEQFNLKLDGAKLEDLDITSRDEPANAQLLQVSAALMSTDNPAETLANISKDIGEDDKIDEEGQAAMDDLQEEMANLDLDEIEEIIEGTVDGAVAPVETNVLNGTLSWDSNMSFNPLNDAFPDTNYTSETVTVNGVIGTSANVSIVNGWFKVNGATATTVSNGDQIEVTVTSSSTYSTEVKAILTVGGKDLPFIVTTKSDPFVPDTIPDDFSFGFKKDMNAGEEATSKEITITGINMATPIAIDNGSFTVNGEVNDTVKSGDKVVVKLNAGALGTTKKATITIGGVEGKFTVSTKAEDKNPIITGSLGSFLDEEKDTTITSNEITITDINVNLPVSVTGGATVSTATVANNGTITVTVTAPSEYATEKTVDLHIGGVVIPFTVKTKPNPFVPDTVPNDFNFKKVKTRTAGIEIESEEITVTGINMPVPISVVGGAYDINGTASTATTISNGATVKLRVTSPDYGLTKEATLNIGGVSAVFKVETEKDEEPEAISFTSLSAEVKNSDSESNIVTISGINVPLAISIDGGEYQIDDGGYTSTAGTIENNQTVQVKLHNANTPATTTVARLHVGNMNIPFVVTTADDAPVIADISGVEATEDQLFRFKPTLSEGKSNNWEIVGALPTWLDFNPINGELRGTPTNDESDVGTYSITIKATNDIGNDTKTFDITIIDVNYPPVLEALPNVTKDEDSPAFTVELNATDRDGTDATYSATSSDESKATVSVTDSTLTVTPIAEASGVVTITVVATDVKGAEDSKTFTLTLTPFNDAAVLESIATQTVDEDSTPLVIELNATDVDADTLTYTATSSDLTKATVAVSGSQLTITPLLNQYGDVTITVKANDGTVDSNTVTFTYSITPVNDAPIANPVTSSTVEDTVKAITLIATDVDSEDALTYSVVTPPVNGTVDISGAIANYTPNADFAGNDSFTYKVNDGTIDSNIATVTISVSSLNDAPVLSVIPPQTMDEDNGTLVVELNATDVDGDTLSYEANSSDDSIATVAISGNQLTITSMPNMNGNVTISVVAKDSELSSDVQTFTVTINPINDAPHLNPIPTQWKEGNQTEIIVELNATDIDGDAITYGATSSNTSRATVALSDNILTINLVDLNGTDVEIIATANDGKGEEVSEHFMVIDPSGRELDYVEFSHNVESGQYEEEDGVDPSSLFASPMYSIRYEHCDGLELDKFTLSSTQLDIKRAEFNETTGDITWRDNWNTSLTITDNEIFIDENEDGVDDFKFKYVGAIEDVDVLNSMLGMQLFDSRIQAYRFLQIRISDTVRFDEDDEDDYVETHGHTDNLFYTSLASFIEHQQNGAYFISNDEGEGGISFADDSNFSDGSGMLIEVTDDGSLVNNNAGTWHVEDGVLYVEPTESLYESEVYKVITDDVHGDVVIRGEYSKSGEEEEFVWFDDEGKNQFLQFLEDEGISYNGGECHDDDGDDSVHEIHPEIYIWGEAVVDENQTQSFWFEARDLDSVRLAEGTPDFITLVEDNDGGEPMSVSANRSLRQNSMPRSVSRNNSSTSEENSWSYYRVDINATATTATGYYAIELIGTNNSLGVDVNETLNLFYGIEAPSVDFDIQNGYIELNQGESRSVDFTLYNADSIEIGETIRWNDYKEVVTSFTDISGNSVDIHPTTDVDVDWYDIELIARDSSSGGEISRWIGVQVNPEGSNHRPDINLTVIYHQLDINSSEEVIATVSTSDIDGDDVNLSIYSPSFVVLEDNNIVYRPDGNETAGGYDIEVYAEDSNGARVDRYFLFELVGDSNGEGGEPILISNLVSGTVNFKDEDSNPIATPNDAFVRIVPSRFQNDDAGWNGLFCKVEDNGSYGAECYTDGNKSGIIDAFNDSTETFQMVVFKNHIEPEDYHWNCGEDIYKWVGDSVSSDSFATIDVSPNDYQDRSGEQCGESGDNDSDGDHIPDSIEALLGMDSSNPDVNDNGILDGLETEGDNGDQFFDKQWHIRSLGTVVNGSDVSTVVGNDLDLLDIYGKYMGYNGGNPIIVQIVDDGVDADHEDLVDNMDLSRSYSHSSSGDTVGDPSPTDIHDTHGTMVAGIMGARAFNGKGVRGIAPFVKVAGSNWIESQNPSGLDKAWLSGDGANEIAVTNNSWGTYFTNDTFYESILEQGTSTLRDGKGRVYVIAAGNDREDAGNSNISYISNSRYAVAVAALKHDNTHASYSSPGGNVIISGYSGDYYQNSPTIATTTVEGQSVNSGDINEKTTWSEDVNQNYTFAMNGTSAASPTVSGSIALVLEACPNLTWRDVKYLLAKHGKRVDSENSSWIQNSSGLWYSNDYGYGLVNPKGMIESCENNYTNLGAERTAEVSGTPNSSLDDNSTVTIGGFDINESINIEWIELTMDSNHTQASDYGIELISPADTTVRVVNWTRAGGDWMNGGFKFGSAGFVDENSSGEWKVKVTDFNINNENLSGTIKSLKIKIYGH